jgi:hypothetical protein
MGHKESRFFFLVGVITVLTLLCMGQTPARQGILIVTVFNPPDNIRLTNSQVFVHLMNAKTMTQIPTQGNGQFRASLAPGYYDVVITNASSVPWAKRIEIVPDQEVSLSAGMVFDIEHSQE